MSIETVRQWRDAALADGWSSEPMYVPHEDETRAVVLKRDGFLAQVITREYPPEIIERMPWMKYMAGKTDASIYVWGPDSLAIRVPIPYSFEACKKLLNQCMDCKNDDVPTQRVGFAGRVCSACLPAAKRRDEYPGWTN